MFNNGGLPLNNSLPPVVLPILPPHQFGPPGGVPGPVPINNNGGVFIPSSTPNNNGQPINNNLGPVSVGGGPLNNGGQPNVNIGGSNNQSPDSQVANHVGQHLSNALAAVQDPELRQSLAVALAALHKYVAARHKENLDALAGKASVRHLANAYGTQL